MGIKLRMTGKQHSLLNSLLYTRDSQEKNALALCGASEWSQKPNQQLVYCLNQIKPLGEELRLSDLGRLASLPSGSFLELLNESASRRQTILKIQSVYPGCTTFSSFDDRFDSEFFSNIMNWLDSDLEGISAILLPNGQVIARTVNKEGIFGEISSVAVAGSDIQVWHPGQDEGSIPESSLRTAQTFGQGTTNMLSRLSVGVVGISGTGSPVVEMLYRLGVGELVLVDGDIVKIENIGRIYNSTFDDVNDAKYKVHVLESAILKSGLPTRVIPIPRDLFHPDVVRRLAQCDVIFGCMDSVDGRDLLNRLSSFYLIPYFDLGVHLDADGKGGVDQVCGTVHYLQPGGSSLFSRGVYTEAELRASALFRLDKEQYREQVKSKYIRGVREEKPAVISVNTLIASLGVNDFLARLHPYREDPNEQFESLGISLTQTRLIVDEESAPCPILAKHVGHGDIRPLLDMPFLSERRA